MKIVIACSNRKNGDFLKYKGNEIRFIADTSKGIANNGVNYYHPDDHIPNEKTTWRDFVKKNQTSFFKAYKLYNNKIYKELYNKFGSNLFILSAGWGLINSEYGLPKYDITFSKQANLFKRRTKSIQFNDFNQLNLKDNVEKIVAFLGKDYLELFYELTKKLPNKKIVFYNSNDLQALKNIVKNDFNFIFIKYETKIRTNWHYECAMQFIKGEIDYGL